MENWRETLVSPDARIKDAVAVVDAVGLQIALVVNLEGRLLGTVTDGDIRRAILRGTSLEDPVASIMNNEPLVARKGEDASSVLGLMRPKRLHQVPLIDNDGRVCGLQIIDELVAPKVLGNPVVIMAGGLGSRLSPLTDETPKPMLNVGKKPILETIVDTLREHGFYDIHLSVNYLADVVEKHFGDGSKYGVKISYLREDKRLGTAGALSLLKTVSEHPILIMNGDVLTNLNYSQLLDYHITSSSDATMCVREYELQIPYGVVETKSNQISAIVEKPKKRYLVNAGVYVLQPDVIDNIPKDIYYDMTDLFTELTKNGRNATVFPVREYWIDIGQPEDYKIANNHFKNEVTE